MTERTTINVDKRTHTAGNHVKTDYSESWPEVVDFYVRYRPIIRELENSAETGQDDVVLGPGYEEIAEKIGKSSDVDEGEIARMVVSDLEGSLPRKIAEELHG